MKPKKYRWQWEQSVRFSLKFETIYSGGNTKFMLKIRIGSIIKWETEAESRCAVLGGILKLDFILEALRTCIRCSMLFILGL